MMDGQDDSLNAGGVTLPPPPTARVEPVAFDLGREARTALANVFIKPSSWAEEPVKAEVS